MSWWWYALKFTVFTFQCFFLFSVNWCLFLLVAEKEGIFFLFFNFFSCQFFVCFSLNYIFICSIKSQWFTTWFVHYTKLNPTSLHFGKHFSFSVTEKIFYHGSFFFMKDSRKMFRFSPSTDENLIHTENWDDEGKSWDEGTANFPLT